MVLVSLLVVVLVVVSLLVHDVAVFWVTLVVAKQSWPRGTLLLLLFGCLVAVLCIRLHPGTVTDRPNRIGTLASGDDGNHHDDETENEESENDSGWSRYRY